MSEENKYNDNIINIDFKEINEEEDVITNDEENNKVIQIKEKIPEIVKDKQIEINTETDLDLYIKTVENLINVVESVEIKETLNEYKNIARETNTFNITEIEKLISESEEINKESVEIKEFLDKAKALKEKLRKESLYRIDKILSSNDVDSIIVAIDERIKQYKEELASNKEEKEIIVSKKDEKNKDLYIEGLEKIKDSLNESTGRTNYKFLFERFLKIKGKPYYFFEKGNKRIPNEVIKEFIFKALKKIKSSKYSFYNPVVIPAIFKRIDDEFENKYVYEKYSLLLLYTYFIMITKCNKKDMDENFSYYTTLITTIYDCFNKDSKYRNSIFNGIENFYNNILNKIKEISPYDEGTTLNNLENIILEFKKYIDDFKIEIEENPSKEVSS